MPNAALQLRRAKEFKLEKPNYLIRMLSRRQLQALVSWRGTIDNFNPRLAAPAISHDGNKAQLKPFLHTHHLSPDEL